jgi:hypothetical protein
MRGLFRFLSLVFGLVLAGWLVYNFAIERQPETEGMSPWPAVALTALLLYGGLWGLRDKY